MFSAPRIQRAGVTLQGVGLVLALVGEWRLAFLALNGAVMLWVEAYRQAP